jgi:hypothetical protein
VLLHISVERKIRKYAKEIGTGTRQTHSGEIKVVDLKWNWLQIEISGKGIA